MYNPLEHACMNYNHAFGLHMVVHKCFGCWINLLGCEACCERESHAQGVYKLLHGKVVLF